MPHDHTSIRVIKTLRESMDSTRRMSIDRDTGAGIVLPSCGSHGSMLAGLDNGQQSSSGNSVLSALTINKATRSRHPSQESKRSVSASSTSSTLYPWKNLSASGRFPATSTPPSEEGGDNNGSSSRQVPSQSFMPKTRSFSGKIARLLSRSEASQPGVADSEHTNNEVVSSSREDLNDQGQQLSRPSTQLDTDLQSPNERSKRKREEEGSTKNDQWYASHSDEIEQPVRHALSPHRVIKPRPSRAAAKRRSVKDLPPIPSVSEATVAPSREFTFTMPHSPQPQPQAKNEVQSGTQLTTTSPATDSATERVFAEMQARLAARAAQKEDTLSSSPQKYSSEKKSGGGASPLLPPSPLKSVESRSRGRFSSQHNKNFDRMDSIAKHYAARRQLSDSTAKSSEGGSPEKGSESIGPEEPRSSTKRQKTQATGNAFNTAPAAKTVTFSAPPTAAVERTEEERAAIRHKLDMARRRRKSGVASVHGSTASRRKSATPASIPTSTGLRAGTFAHKVGIAVRGFVGAAASRSGKANDNDASSSKHGTLSDAVSQRSASPVRLASTAGRTTSKPVFDLQASLARKPRGYKPYSSKQTAELIAAAKDKTQASAARSPAPASASPICDGWTWVPSPSKYAEDDRDAVPFPTAPPPPKRTLQMKRASVAKAPTVNGAGARKMRSSTSHAARASLRTRSSASRSAGGSSSSSSGGSTSTSTTGRSSTTTSAGGAGARRTMAGPSATLKHRRLSRGGAGTTSPSGAINPISSTPTSGIARPRAVAMRSGLAGQGSVGPQAKASLLPRRAPGAGIHGVSPRKAPGVSPADSSPSKQSGLPSTLRRMSGRGRGQPSVRNVDAMEVDAVGSTSADGSSAISASS